MLHNLQEYVVKIESLMVKMKLLVRRENNEGLKVGKFHEMLHIIRDIELFGPPYSFDGRPGDSSHKDTKKCAVKTQRRKNKFEYQNGYRIYENLMISKAASFILPPKNKKKLMLTHGMMILSILLHLPLIISFIELTIGE